MSSTEAPRWTGPGSGDPIPCLIGPSTDWEHVINAWCSARTGLEDFARTRPSWNGKTTPPGQVVAAALRRLGPPLAAARLGHHMEWDPRYQNRATSDSPWICTDRRWTCCACLSHLTVPLQGDATGPALTVPCSGRTR